LQLSVDFEEQEKPLHPAGQILAAKRQKLGLTPGDVEVGSAKLVEKHGKNVFLIHRGFVDDIETKGAIPSAHQFYSLSVIYRIDIRQLLGWYGIELEHFAADVSLIDVPKSHIVSGLDSAISIEVPVTMDPGCDPTRSMDIARMVVKWGYVPFAYLRGLAHTEYAFAYIGTEDWMMYPLIPPGSFLQIDKARNKITKPSPGISESPIYFVQTPDGYTCCLCVLDGDNIVLHPHPASRQAPRVLRHPQDVVVVGQVIAAAIRFDGKVSPRRL